jgi:hypothetical protein
MGVLSASDDADVIRRAPIEARIEMVQRDRIRQSITCLNGTKLEQLLLAK